jgi:hypothetical protein
LLLQNSHAHHIVHGSGARIDWILEAMHLPRFESGERPDLIAAAWNTFMSV